MNQKNIIIIVVVLIAALLIGGGGYYFLSKSASKQVATQQQQQGDQQVLTLQPSDIGLALTAIASGKFAGNGVTMEVAKLGDIASVDYELEYTAKGGIPRGAIGHIDIKPTDTIIKQQLPFGTCSDVCHFDQDVTDVKITLKVTKNDGKIYQVAASYNQ
jgi:hypothetical protein